MRQVVMKTYSQPHTPMWKPADITAIPTARELIDAKLAIETVEIELEDALLSLTQAQLRVATIQKDLRERKAWIAPVRRLSLDALSLIFEVCGEDDWKTPLRIAGVSRQWRELVLETPRAWAFLDMEECEDEEDIIRFFFEHSGQRPLHVWLPDSSSLTLLSDVAHRLRCLSLWVFYPENCEIVFPHVECLNIRADDILDVVTLSDIRFNRFPALRHLICEPSFVSAIPVSIDGASHSIGPLQALSLVMTEDFAWLDLLTTCKDTLLSLRLHLYYEPAAPLGGTVVLSKLKCLEVQYWPAEPDLWALTLETPLLETYIEENEVPNAIPLHQDIGRVKFLRLGTAPMLSMFPALIALQLEDVPDLDAVLSQLVEEEALCPELTLIEISEPLEMSEPNDTVAEVNKRRQSENITVVPSSRTPLIGIITESPCGEGMPCSK